jgi:hypothetical protein
MAKRWKRGTVIGGLAGLAGAIFFIAGGRFAHDVLGSWGQAI